MIVSAPGAALGADRGDGSQPQLTPEASEVVIAVLGDSLTAGYGLPETESFPVQLQAALRDKGHRVTIRNAGVSGDTTAGGVARLDWTLQERPDGLIVELGANDALRGLDPAEAEKNLDAILTRLKDENLPVLLAGMAAPRNMGQDYTKRFDAIYPKLAEKHNVLLYPFFLDGVATDRALNQDDGLHPNAKGVAVIVTRITPSVEALLEIISANAEAPAERPVESGASPDVGATE